MNSCLYQCTVYHNRLEPRANRFSYDGFIFCLDLDELDVISRKFRLISHNHFNVFNFRDDDHLRFTRGTVKNSVLEYLKRNGIEDVTKVLLVTNLCTFGYSFNPVSFYFCYGAAGQPICTIPEVGNTFDELKPFLLTKEHQIGDSFFRRVSKFFYVSPFIAMDAEFEFDISIPGNDLKIRIDDYQNGRKFFISSLTGKRRELSDSLLAWYSIRFPLITLRILGLIHWQALRLWLKNIRYYKKADSPDLQREVHHGRNHERFVSREA